MVHGSSRWREVVGADFLIRVSLCEPVAVVRRQGEPDRVVTWPDLPLGSITPHTRIVAAPDGAWVLYTPATADETTEHEGAASQVESTVIHISPSGDVPRFLGLVNVHPVGTTRHGLWLWSGHWDANVDVEEHWLAVREILVLDAGGGTHHTSIDRIPSTVFEDESSPHLVVYASAPEAVYDGYGGAGYTYRYLNIDLPAGELPAALRVEELSSTSIEEPQIPGWSEDDAPPTYPSVSGDPRMQWDRIYLPEDQKKAAVDAVRAEFDNLDEYWRTSAGAMAPLTEGVSDARVDVIGHCPDTQIEVSFVHHHYPEGRLRRTYRVFDDAGRIRSVQYASIHLMEDLDTRALPPVENARNAILHM